MAGEEFVEPWYVLWKPTIGEVMLSDSYHADGGGIRGYWTLLLLERLMEAIAEEERNQAEQKGESVDTTGHSFAPLPYPEGVTQGSLNDIEHKLQREGKTDYRAYRDSRKYLPCHYFDLICGSDTGA